MTPEELKQFEDLIRYYHSSDLSPTKQLAMKLLEEVVFLSNEVKRFQMLASSYERDSSRANEELATFRKVVQNIQEVDPEFENIFQKHWREFLA